MKVYVLTKGEYSDYSIYAVVDDKAKAELLKEALSDEYDEANIEEYDTEDANIDGYLKCAECYLASQDISTDQIEFRKTPRYNSISDSSVWERENNEGKTILMTFIYEDRSDYAFKIAADRFAKYKAEKAGL